MRGAGASPALERALAAGVVFVALTLTGGCANVPGSEGGTDSVPPRPPPPLSTAAEASALAAEAQAAKDGEAAPVGTAVPAAASLAIARVDGKAIEVGELLGAWLHADGIAMGQHVDTLVSGRLARSDAEGLGLVVAEEKVEARLQEARAEAEAALRKARVALPLETYVRTHLGLDPGAYVARLRKDCEEQLVIERVVRAFTLACERVEGRVIVVEDRSAAEKVSVALGAGEDFGEVAKKWSVDPTKDRGGRVYAIVKAEESPLAQLAFRTPVGEVSGPLEQGGRQLFLKVEGKPQTWRGTWSEVGEVVEGSLVGEPVTETEFLQWKASAERRHEVDLRPLYELLGEPLPALDG